MTHVDELDMSISIVSYNDRDFLEPFLTSIYETTKGISFEVLVVCNGTADGTADMIREKYPQVDLVVNSRNRFFTYATNQNLARARGDFIVYLSSDTLVSDHSFQPMVEMLREDPMIGVIGPLIYDFDGNVHSPGQKFPTVFASILDLVGFHKRFPMNRLWLARHYRSRDPFQTFDVDSVSGACLMTRRSVLEQVGLLDEHLVMFYDEHDFCRRVREHGLRVTHCGMAEIWHYGHGTCRRAPSELISRLMQDSFFYLHRKYYGVLAYLLLRAISCIVERIAKLRRLGNH